MASYIVAADKMLSSFFLSFCKGLFGGEREKRDILLAISEQHLVYLPRSCFCNCNMIVEKISYKKTQACILLTWQRRKARSHTTFQRLECHLILCVIVRACVCVRVYVMHACSHGSGRSLMPWGNSIIGTNPHQGLKPCQPLHKLTCISHIWFQGQSLNWLAEDRYENRPGERAGLFWYALNYSSGFYDGCKGFHCSI